MNKITKTIATLSAAALFIPGLTLASTGTEMYEGSGVVKGVGMGFVEVHGKGTLKVSGTGTLTVSQNARVKIVGEGTRTETADGIQYSGFNGEAVVKGKNVSAEFSGDVEKFRITGTGNVKVSGDGTVSAHGKFKHVQSPVSTEKPK